MAGTYPDAPGPRIAYDRDGTKLFYWNDSDQIITEAPGSATIALNDDSNTTAWAAPWPRERSLLLFPRPIDLTHWAYLGANADVIREPMVSTNTVTGIDGTWTSITRPQMATTKTELRNTANIQAVTANGIVALRFRAWGNMGLPAIHLYGKPSADSDRLEFWHPTLDQPLSNTPAHFDYGDVPRGSAPVTKSFRIKNISSTLSANTITVGCEALADATPTMVSQTQFAYNDGSFAGTASLNTLAANTISQVFTVRLTTTSTSALSTWSQRYYANAADWS